MKTQVPIIIDVELLKQVDDYLHENRMKNRSRFICSLIEGELAMKMKPLNVTFSPVKK